MKNILFLFLLMIFTSGCYVGFRTPYYKNYNPYRYNKKVSYYKSHSNYFKRINPKKKYRGYFNPGRY